MTAIQFIDLFESKAKELELLTLIKEQLTPKGLDIYNKIKNWLIEHQEQYFEALEEIQK